MKIINYVIDISVPTLNKIEVIVELKINSYSWLDR